MLHEAVVCNPALPAEGDLYEVSVVIPCLNEAETIVACIEAALTAFAANSIVGEVVVADNGSMDGSQALAADAGARVVPVPVRGYGSALIHGMEAARGRYLIMGDADFSYDFGELPRFVTRLRQGDDLVVGCRMPRHGGTIHPGAMPPLHRYLGTPVLTFLGRIFFRHPCHDINAGMRGLSKVAFEALRLRCTGMEFATEMIAKAALMRLRISEVPITLRKDGRSRPPHLRTWRDGWRHLRFMLLLSPVWLFGIPGTLLVFLGGVLLILMRDFPKVIGTVTLDVNTLIAAAMMFAAGLQILLFGFFVRRFALIEGILPGRSQPEGGNRRHELEILLLCGTGLMLFGLTGVITGFASWQATGFGTIAQRIFSYWFVLYALAAVCGLQTLFFGFVLGALDLKTRMGFSGRS